jgi:hypothetical protein
MNTTQNNMADFSQDIAKFQKDGTYEYKFDAHGNLYFNSSSADFSQVYLSLPLINVVYNNAKIEKFYDPMFREFIPTTVPSITSATTDDLHAQLGVVQQENITLKSHLDSLIAENEMTSNSSDSQAVKQIILELRIALGQGRVSANFSDTFPYPPLTAPQPSQKI